MVKKLARYGLYAAVGGVVAKKIIEEVEPVDKLYRYVVRQSIDFDSRETMYSEDEIRNIQDMSESLEEMSAGHDELDTEDENKDSEEDSDSTDGDVEVSDMSQFMEEMSDRTTLFDTDIFQSEEETKEFMLVQTRLHDIVKIRRDFAFALKHINDPLQESEVQELIDIFDEDIPEELQTSELGEIDLEGYENREIQYNIPYTSIFLIQSLVYGRVKAREVILEHRDNKF